jgi:hypothetical protein
VRFPAVAGLFYPGDRDELAATVDALLATALAIRVPQATRAATPKAVVVPHAGYVYSGPIAATAYARLAPGAGDLGRVVLLGPAHRAALDGLALPTVDAFRTPLGDVPIDDDARHTAAALPGVVLDDGPHEREHSLEVQLPFLQRLLPDFALVPLVVGRAAPATVAAAIDTLWGGTETVVVVSTDLSHYEPYEAAARHDRATAAAIVARALDTIGPYDACGAFGLRGLLDVARRRDLVPEVLDLRSSGDTAGPPDRVVGYGAFALAASRPGDGQDSP